MLKTAAAAIAVSFVSFIAANTTNAAVIELRLDAAEPFVNGHPFGEVGS